MVPATIAAIARLLRLAALLVSAVVIVSFVLFAVEQAGAASDAQRRALGSIHGPAPTDRSEQKREARNGEVREYIDDANDSLVSPFTGLVEGQGVWVRRVVTGLLAVLLYGVVVTIGANYVRK